MSVLRALCRVLVRTFPPAAQRASGELPQVIVDLVEDAAADRGRWAAARTALQEVVGLIAASGAAWALVATRAISRARRSTKRGLLDVRILLRLARRDGIATAAILLLIAAVSGTVAGFATLALDLRGGPTFSTSDRLLWVWGERGWEPDGTPLVSDVHLAHLRDRARGFEGLAGMWMVSGRVTGGTRPFHADVARVSANFFDLLDVEPQLGRLFREGEDAQGSPWSVVLTHETWQTHFGGDPDVLGRSVIVGVPEMTVVGVLPQDFRFDQPDALGPYGEPSVWLPARHSFGGGTVPHDVQAILALRDEAVSPAAIEAETLRLSAEADSVAYAGRGFRYRLQGLPSGRAPTLERAVGLIGIALGAVLLVAAAGLFLLGATRSSRRRPVYESLRLVGATRTRLAGLIAVESMMTAFLGWLGGLVLAAGGLRWLSWSSTTPDGARRLPSADADTAALAAIIATALAFAYAASAGARAFARPRSSTPRKPARLAVALQVALASCLLVGMLGLQGSLRRALEGEAGFRTGNLVAFTLYPMPDDYPDGAARDAFLGRTVDRVEGHPDISHVTAGSALPLTGGSTQLPAGRSRPAWTVDPESFSVAEWTGFDGALGPRRERDATVLTDINVARPGFLPVLGLSVREGRDFRTDDEAFAPPVTVISEGLASYLWPDGGSVGDSLWLVGRWRRVVGVVADAPLHGLASETRPQAWLPHAQVLAGRVAVVMETGLPVDSVKAIASAAVASIDPTVPVGPAFTLRTLVRAETDEERFVANLVTAFSIISLLLGAIAVYGVTAAVVTARSRELGVRIALGVSRRALSSSIAGAALTITAAGSLMGVGLYALLERWLNPLAFVGAPPAAPTLYLLATVTCLVAVAVAVLEPAVRAARVDPTSLLTDP